MSMLIKVKQVKPDTFQNGRNYSEFCGKFQNMNRFQRKLYRYPRKEDKKEIQEVFPPKIKRNIEKPMTNRCCSISPKVTDAEQCTEFVSEDQYQNLLIEQYGFDPRNLDTLDQIKELKKIICGSQKIENSSQYDNPIDETSPFIDTDVKWQDVDNTEDIEKFLVPEKDETYTTDEIEISEVPKIKVIAEKFMNFKKDNIEVRKLDEKVVCVEYDVFKKKKDNEFPEPVQKLRTYFSIKPVDRKDPCIPSSVKLKYKVASEDLNNLNDKEVEIIDGKISENRPYLEDLRKCLKRKQAFEKKSKTLDLMTLYKMAKRNENFNDDFELLSKAELDEIKDLITKNCASSIHGISRRTYKNDNESKKEKTTTIVSESIFTELLRNVE